LSLELCKVDTLSLESHLQSILLWLFLEMGVLRTICLGWPPMVILPISASPIARITGVSHQCLASQHWAFGGVG
jgi:hypothetical protein